MKLGHDTMTEALRERPQAVRTFNKSEPGTTSIEITAIKNSPLFEGSAPHVVENVIVPTEDAPAHVADVLNWLEAHDQHYGYSDWKYMVNLKDHVVK